MNSYSLTTNLVHAGEENICEGAVCTPIFQSSTYLTQENEKEYHDGRYIRLNNTPNQISLAKKLACIEKGELACLFPSGMSAISMTMLTLLKEKDTIVAQKCLYGATLKLMKYEFPKLGIHTKFIDIDMPNTWGDSVNSSAKVLYIEAITNPLLEVVDFQKIVYFAKENGLITIIDNTFATPINFNPIELGFDLVIHSCSKYMSGHMDIVAGCVIGKKELVEKIIQKTNYMGSCLDPNVCFLLMRSMPTLELRVKMQNINALRLAQFLENHSSVKRVIYPGLVSHPNHQQAKQYFSGYGGMLCFELKSTTKTSVQEFLTLLRIPLLAPSLGGIKTLITRPALTSHVMLPLEKEKLDITLEMIRVSVGIESIDDLIKDFDNALSTAVP